MDRVLREIAPELLARQLKDLTRQLAHASRRLRLSGPLAEREAGEAEWSEIARETATAPADRSRKVNEQAGQAAARVARRVTGTREFPGERLGRPLRTEDVPMLLAISDYDVARLLVGCPARLRGELLQGIAASRPATAGRVLSQFPSAVAGQAFAYLGPQTAAAVAATMEPAEARRILANADERTVTAVIIELADPELAASLLPYLSEGVRQRVSRYLAPVQVPLDWL
jgi:hypothetical protein